MSKPPLWLIVIAGVVPAVLIGVAMWVWMTIPPEPDPDALPSSVFETPSAEYRDAVEEGRFLARRLIAEEKLPGLSLAVAVNGEIVWAEGFRWADMENETPVTPATRFRIGGVSQCLTAAAAGLLSERGRLDLDAPVQRYVTDFPEKEWPFSARQLMGNVAGIRPHRSEAGILRGSGCTDDAGRLAGFAGDPLVFRPGTARAYSTHAWALAGAVIAAAANEPYPEFMRREVFAPLQMDSTVPDIAGRSDPDAATFYYPRFALDPRLGLQDSPQVDLACHLPAAGFLSTPSDLVRFGSAMMGGRLLDPATVAELWIPVRLESGEPTGESLGWSWSTLFDAAGDSTRVVGRGLGDVVVRRPLSATTVEGQVAGSTTSLLTVPRHFIAVAVATNVSGAGNVPLLATRLAGIFIARLSGLPPGPTGG